jgi:hypothetical protein
LLWLATFFKALVNGISPFFKFIFFLHVDFLEICNGSASQQLDPTTAQLRRTPAPPYLLTAQLSRTLLIAQLPRTLLTDQRRSTLLTAQLLRTLQC